MRVRYSPEAREDLHKIADESGYIVGGRLTLFGVLTVFDSRHIEYLDE